MFKADDYRLKIQGLRSVLDEADRLGITGYRQGRASAQALYTPDFKEGIVQEEQP